ncbi:MAG: LysR family transcriptional regulator [Paracoccaceae bacterium]|nr:LysR family transcriptional regulator [Paracoccaceae bacterium]
MARNLDLTALRSFVGVVDSGGVTRAAGFLNLTQSAVSMQLKRLEESLGLQLFDRTGRGVTLTASGEQLLGYARQMLALNDEVQSRLTQRGFEGEIVLGVPHDIVYPAIPQVLQRFHREHPRVRVHLVSSFTNSLKEQFARGECDVILTTEGGCGLGGETVASLPLVWLGAPDGSAWRQRPLKLAFENKCIFRQGVQASLNAADISWEMAVESEQSRTIEASVSADLAVHVMLEGTAPPYSEVIQHGGALPELGRMNINLYQAEPGKGQIQEDLVDFVRQAIRGRADVAMAAS